jgi:sigma-54 dependent transcriptional regulator, acetoin dehydrogenase operon transcriptional activator AcoR
MHHPLETASSRRLRLPVELSGTAPSVEYAADLARRAAASDDSVLIVAERGFCAEGVARAIHDAGPRAGDPFLVIDCGESPLVVPRLFGTDPSSRSEYETAAFGSALSRARRGTIFLAGVDQMPVAAQSRLSRILRDGEMRIRKVIVSVCVRLMASTPPGLEADVREQRFRPELYRRLQRVRIEVPPLRDRAGDLPGIIQAVFDEVCVASGHTHRLAPAAMTALAALRWTGNLAELRETLVRLVDRSDNGLIRQEDVLADLQHPHRPPLAQAATARLRDARVSFEREYISTVLEAYGWRMTEAARVLGIERANLYRKTRQLGITRLKPSRAS